MFVIDLLEKRNAKVRKIFENSNHRHAERNVTSACY